MSCLYDAKGITFSCTGAFKCAACPYADTGGGGPGGGGNPPPTAEEIEMARRKAEQEEREKREREAARAEFFRQLGKVIGNPKIVGGSLAALFVVSVLNNNDGSGGRSFSGGSGSSYSSSGGYAGGGSDSSNLFDRISDFFSSFRNSDRRSASASVPQNFLPEVRYQKNTVKGQTIVTQDSIGMFPLPKNLSGRLFGGEQTEIFVDYSSPQVLEIMHFSDLNEEIEYVYYQAEDHVYVALTKDQRRLMIGAPLKPDFFDHAYKYSLPLYAVSIKLANDGSIISTENIPFVHDTKPRKRYESSESSFANLPADTEMLFPSRKAQLWTESNDDVLHLVDDGRPIMQIKYAYYQPMDNHIYGITEDNRRVLVLSNINTVMREELLLKKYIVFENSRDHKKSSYIPFQITSLSYLQEYEKAAGHSLVRKDGLVPLSFNVERDRFSRQKLEGLLALEGEGAGRAGGFDLELFEKEPIASAVWKADPKTLYVYNSVDTLAEPLRVVWGQEGFYIFMAAVDSQGKTYAIENTFRNMYSLLPNLNKVVFVKMDGDVMLSQKTAPLYYVPRYDYDYGRYNPTVDGIMDSGALRQQVEEGTLRHYGRSVDNILGIN